MANSKPAELEPLAHNRIAIPWFFVNARFDGSELNSVCPSNAITALAESALNLKDSSSAEFSILLPLKILGRPSETETI